MKIHPLILGVLASSWLAGSGLRAQEVDLQVQLDEIRELLKPADADAPEIKDIKASLQRYPEQWQRLIDQGQFTGFSEYGVQSAAAAWAKIPGLTEKVQELTKSVAEEGSRRDAAKIAKAEALISLAGETLKNAKKAEELDALMLALSKSKISDYNNNPKLSGTSPRSRTNAP